MNGAVVTVFGATGRVGREAVKRLLDRGATVRGMSEVMPNDECSSRRITSTSAKLRFRDLFCSSSLISHYSLRMAAALVAVKSVIGIGMSRL